jgi:hypothetical protein
MREHRRTRGWLRMLGGVGFLGAVLNVGTSAGVAQGTAAVVARAGVYTLTSKDMSDILALNSLVLATPLSAAEQQEQRQNILEQFQKNPSVLAAGGERMHKLAEVARSGSLFDRSELASYLWCSWLNGESKDPITARWVAMIRRHNPPIVSGDGLVVTKLQFDALFATNDWVAQTAGLPLSTTESRAAFEREVQAKFASLPRQAKENLANADRRWAALESTIIADAGLKEKAVSLVHQNVHGPADVGKEARTLEDDGLRFAKLEKDMSKQTQAMIGGLSGQAAANNLSVYNHTMGPH